MIQKARIFSIGMATLLMMACSTRPKNEGQTRSEIDKDERMEWWREAKFGLFIHWGIPPTGIILE